MKKKPISKALIEVWEWKEKVYTEIKNKTFEEKEKYYQEGLDEAVKMLNGKLMKNPEGNYLLLKT